MERLNPQARIPQLNLQDHRESRYSYVMQKISLMSFCLTAASFIAGLTIPIAYPDAPRWIGYLGVAISAVLAVMGLAFVLKEQRSGLDKQSCKTQIGLDEVPDQAHSDAMEEALFQDELRRQRAKAKAKATLAFEQIGFETAARDWLKQQDQSRR